MKQKLVTAIKVIVSPEKAPAKPTKKMDAAFYKNTLGNEPVREWLKTLTLEDRQAIGADIRTAEYGWPIGMPTCKALGSGLFEIRTNISDGRITRIIFVVHDGSIYLLHGFVKKTEKLPQSDLDLATKRKKEVEK